MSSATAQAPAKNGRGTLYRGHGGMWSWVGHRVTGVVIFFY
ncbi:succinate dehydrogenase, cytochrome b556 subunit, partial [Streptomyces sp. NPDC051172]